MLKLFNDYAKTRFVAEMKRVDPRFEPKKSLRGPLAGAINLEFVLDAARRAWICFGGFKDRDFAIFAAWTVSGRPLKELEEWEQYGNPRAFELPPVPADGCVDLRDRWRFDANWREFGAWHDLSVAAPPQDFAETAFEAFRQTRSCEDEIAVSYAGALRLSAKNPPDPERHREEWLRAEFAYCKSVWSHLATRRSFGEEECVRFVEPVVLRAVELARVYGVEFALARLP